MSNRLITIGVVLFILQACTTLDTTGGNAVIDEKVDRLYALSELEEQIDELSKGEKFVISSETDAYKTEYTLVDEYTSASGKNCREISVKKLNAGASPDVSIMCQGGQGKWYTLKNVILK